MGRSIIGIFLFAVTFCNGYVFGESWQDATEGLTDGEFYSIAKGCQKDGETIYIGASRGLYEKKLPSRSWKRIFTCRIGYGGINDIHVTANNTIYIATKNGLYESADSGKTWKRLFRGIGRENHSSYVTVDPENSAVIYLGTLKGLFRTGDGGNTWKKSPGVLGSAKVTSASLTQIRGERHLFVVSRNEIYEIGEDFGSYKKVFASGSSGNVEDDADDADDMDEAEDNEENNPIFLINDITAKKGILYVSTNRGLFISMDGGASWIRFNDAGLSDRRINSVLVADINTPGVSERIFAATMSGVFAYDKKEALWEGAYHGMRFVSARKLMPGTNGTIWALCNKGVYKAKFEYEHTHTEDKNPLSPDRIFSEFGNEPTINETIDMAIEYAEVNPDKIRKWRRGASYRALFPKVSFGLDYGRSDTYEIYTSSSTSYWTYGPEDKTEGWDLSFSWDLSDLVWNPSQTAIDIRSKLMVQLRNDIADEVTRTYFERRRLQVELLMYPPGNADLIVKKKLRMQELTAYLDGFTGSRFSRSIN